MFQDKDSDNNFELLHPSLDTKHTANPTASQDSSNSKL